MIFENRESRIGGGGVETPVEMGLKTGGGASRENSRNQMAHGGGPDGLEECIDLALRFEQVVVEPSWINILGVEKLLRVLGPEKIMFSSDMPQNVPVSLEIFRQACKGSQSKLEHVFYKTAERVFSL